MKRIIQSAIAFGCAVAACQSTAFAQSLEKMSVPSISPTNFEDPRSRSEVRPIFIYHEIDNDFVTQGGDVQIYALQLRYAIDDRLAIIATKDGYVDFNPNAVLGDERGFADVAAGVKYAFFKDDASGQILTAGLRYEAPVGEREVFSGRGDGAVNPFLSGAASFENFNVMFGTGFRLAIDEDDSSFYDFAAQIDTTIGEIVHPLLAVSVEHVIDAGNRLPIADEGEDFFNLGASEADGKTLVTAAAGIRLDLANNVNVGAAYQIPLTNGRGSNIIDWRFTTDMVVTF